MMTSFTSDVEMFHRCRIEARNKIIENKAESDIVKIQNQIFFGEEARDFLKTNIIQGIAQTNGNYRFKAKPEHSMKDNIKY